MSGILVAGADVIAKVGEIAAARIASGLFQTRILSQTDVEARSQADGAPFTRAINGVEDADDAALKLDGGTITYTFRRLGPAVDYALQLAAELSPDPGGPYSRAWFVMVGGLPWTQATAEIPAGAVAIITNFQPYHRRLEQGWHRGRSAQHRPGLFITESVRQDVQMKFPYVAVAREFVPISTAPAGATNVVVPWVLRRGKEAGAPILYPGVSLMLAGS